MRALFIDDNVNNRTVMVAMLSTAGVELEEAPNGPEGLEKIEEEDYDFILIDLRMPDMDGFGVIRCIRARDDSKSRLPIVVVTADGADGLAARCVEAGADAMISKPVEMNQLFETVGAILARTPGAHA